MHPSASLEVLSFPYPGFIKEAGGGGTSEMDSDPDSVAKVAGAGTAYGNSICADDGRWGSTCGAPYSTGPGQLYQVVDQVL